VDSVVSRIPIPVAADVSGDRFPSAIEATAYFIISEALTNAAKHSGADHAEVRVHREDGVLRVEVRDDGVGGANLNEGSGLIGFTIGRLRDGQLGVTRRAAAPDRATSRRASSSLRGGASLAAPGARTPAPPPVARGRAL
jgi:nitrate/nitrite-specific signal transduction histidine kinase